MAPTPSRTSADSAPYGEPSGPARAEGHLDARYGRTRAYRLRRRWIAAIVGGAFVVVFGAWVVFAAFDGTSATVDTNDAGYTIHNDHSATVRSQINVDAGTKVDCAIEVLNSGFDVVGWKVVHFPAQKTNSTVYTNDLNTTNRGVTGLIDKCWLP